ncbi:hypothetical protein B0H16DRAFT_710827 [Mycena metata]|uniref:Uncharacterized protein n=1 Tax=Mycena metata TaxID=1033252 RepID=A0AAD7GT84_9AGAR|nr:hypothetical protein B0H16DRAFT_710827 [Mycena metata]
MGWDGMGLIPAAPLGFRVTRGRGGRIVRGVCVWDALDVFPSFFFFFPLSSFPVSLPPFTSFLFIHLYLLPSLPVFLMLTFFYPAKYNGRTLKVHYDKLSLGIPSLLANSDVTSGRREYQVEREGK